MIACLSSWSEPSTTFNFQFSIVAGPGIAPRFRAYGTRDLLLVHPAICLFNLTHYKKKIKEKVALVQRPGLGSQRPGLSWRKLYSPAVAKLWPSANSCFARPGNSPADGPKTYFIR